MLQRAASNAYSWWWASHIRTKQSKWLEQNLQDMEEKVQSMLKLIEEDGDSFAKRAEMYYKKRPELINFVEESYRAYRSLAERYDKISTELQNANNTIASVFPEQVQLAMEDEDEYGSPIVPKNASQASVNNAPKVPKYPNRDLKGLLTSASKQLQAKKLSKASNTNKTATKSGLSKSEALEEIDKIQKEILALQTVKEFVKSSYENGLTKYWDIENRIIELQETVFSLQDEFRVGKVIEDGEARTLMAEAALKSCEEALAQLQEKQERSTQEARSEFKKVEDAREKVKSLKNKFLPDQQADEEKPHDKDESTNTGENPQGLNPEAGHVTQERQEMDALREKIKVHFEESSKESLSVTEMVVKIDDLVSKVISMETAVSSQTALIDRLKTENDDLQEQIQILEDDKATLIEGTNSLLNRLREMEEKLNRLQDLNQNVENQNNNLQTYFTEARCSLDHLSENLHCLKPDEELEYMESLQEEEQPFVEVKTPEELEKQEDMPSPGDGSINSGELKAAVGDNKNEQVLSMSVILQNYNDVKEKLSDVEKKNRDSLFETTVQLRELSSAIAKRDEEIQSLRQKLNLLQEIFGENRDLKEDDHSISILLDDRNAKPEAMDDCKVNGALEIPMIKKEEEEIKLILIDQPQSISPIQEKLRMNIEALLDENLDFWLRFSTSFHQIQKLKTRFQDLQAEISKLKEKEKTNQEGSPTTDIKSDLRPIYKHLREIQTELTLWIEQSALLNDELQRRSSSLCHIQDKLTQVLKAGAEEEMEFSNHEAAKFQGEILNMKRENSKVRQELQAGLDQVTALQHEIEKTLAKLNVEFGLAGLKNNNQSQLRNLPSRTRVPLGAFIFGTKPKKKTSIFACMHPRKFHNLRGAAPM